MPIIAITTVCLSDNIMDEHNISLFHVPKVVQNVIGAQNMPYLLLASVIHLTSGRVGDRL